MQNIYANLLSKLLKHSKIISDKIYSQKISEEKNNKKKKKKIEEVIEKNNEYLNHYMEYTFQKINYPDIFSNLLNVVYKADLISDIKLIYINQLKKIYNDNCQKNKNNNIISEICFKILLVYSLSNKEEEKNIENIIEELSFNKGYFQSLINLIKYIKFKDEDNKYTKIEENKNEIYSLSLPDINNLNQFQKNTLLILYQYLISILFINDDNNELEQIYINEKITQKDAQKIYAILKNLFDIIIKCNESNLNKIIFSSENKITSELFYFKWVLSDKEDKNNLIRDLKLYHDELLKSHDFPFIFKFILLLNQDKNNINKINLIEDLFSYLNEKFDKYFNDRKINKEDYYYIINLINYLIVFHNIIIGDKKLFFII